jgi:glycosyltransferase involved in cell wall biosynthesis
MPNTADTPTPKVSLVVPTYNQAQYLGACLDSIYFQDYPNIEVIVVNDCSPDDTAEVIAEFQRAVKEDKVSYASNYNERTDEVERTWRHRYPQHGRELVVMHNERNMGSTRTYNRGFEAATGAYITYIASDDICHPQMVSEMVAVLESGEADFVYADMFVIDDAGRILREFRVPDYSFEACFRDWYLCGVAKLYRRELLGRFGLMNPDYLANDHEQYLRFAMQGVRFRHIPKVLYSVRSHDQRNTGVHSSANWKKLMEESKHLVREARAHLAAGQER